MFKKNKIISVNKVVVKFAGDSGDGMQLTGSQFSNTSAFHGNDLSTFPDYPAEIRAPHGTVAGVSGFQIHIGGEKVSTPGDKADVLVAMNPAALKANLKWLKPSATIIIDGDNFDSKYYKIAGYDSDPLTDGTVQDYTVVNAPITSLTRTEAREFDLDNKTADKMKSQFAAGLIYYLFNRDLEIGEDFLRNKFKGKDKLIEANVAILKAGYNFAETIEAFNTTYQILPVKNRKGKFRNITGNKATAWGLIAAAEKCKKELFCGSYPITPASEIFQELINQKQLGVKVFQAEDEIAGICSAIGASFGGDVAVTTTSGPGLALKSEGLGLAVITELPVVVVNVQRGGPSTGLPTKTEQGDLMQALYGRNGESPCIVIAASTPANCFDYSYMAVKLAIEHMTPVILLTDGYIANGSELWKIPSVKDLASITPLTVKDNDEEFKPYLRDQEKLARRWAVPGQRGLRHQIGGLEKADILGHVSLNPANHQKMTKFREEKVQRVANYIPEQEVIGAPEGDVLVVGWGGTYGSLYTAVTEMIENDYKVALAQFNYIKPLPKNTLDIFKRYKHIIVCELNLGQFTNYLRSQLPEIEFKQYNKVQGLPFLVSELQEVLINLIEKK